MMKIETLSWIILGCAAFNFVVGLGFCIDYDLIPATINITTSIFFVLWFYLREKENL